MYTSRHIAMNSGLTNKFYFHGTFIAHEDSPHYMQLPKKITPDSITEAVVEIRYNSAIPYEVLVGLLFNALTPSFKYTNRPVQQSLQGVPVNLGGDLTLRLGTQNLFYNQKISILLLPNAFVFSCLNQYIGWHDYRPQIEEGLKIISATGFIQSWTRVGLRYISEYPQKDLKECTKFDFGFGFPEVQSETTTFRSEFQYRNKRVVLSLANKQPVVTRRAEKQAELVPTSVIDIDIIADSQNIASVDALLNVIDDNHKCEKEIYFRMLRDDFLQSLKPEY